MLDSLKPVLYVRISPERLRVRDVRAGKEISDVPELAIGANGTKRVILAVGAEARRAASGQSAEIVNPFAHPRTLISDFTVAEKLLKEFIRRARGSSILAIAPVIIMHPLGSPAGGFTQVERRAFRELAVGAGASKVVLWVGRELSDQEAQSKDVLANLEGQQ